MIHHHTTLPLTAPNAKHSPILAQPNAADICYKTNRFNGDFIVRGVTNGFVLSARIRSILPSSEAEEFICGSVEDVAERIISFIVAAAMDK